MSNQSPVAVSAKLDPSRPDPPSAGDPMRRVAERLRDEFNRVESPAYLEGRREGRRWAAERASIHQLWRFAEIREWRSQSGEWRGSFPDVAHNQPVPPATALVRMVGGPGPQGNVIKPDACQFFAEIGIGDALERPQAFVLGFADGIAALWKSVENDL